MSGRKLRTAVAPPDAGADALGLDHGITPLAARGGDVTAPDASAVAAYAALRPAHRRLYEMVGEFFRQF